MKKEMLAELNEKDIKTAFSSLAAGADQLFATLVVNKGISLSAIIPGS